MKRIGRIVGASYVLAAVLLADGCGEKKKRVSPPAPATNAAAEKSASQILIENVTGKAALDQGRAAQDKIRKVSSEHNKDLDEVTE